MAYIKRIVCLANSYKPPDGRCIAGKEVLANGAYGRWIRPVSARATAELSFHEYKYQNNAIPKLLDIMDVPLLNAAPRNHQSENHVIDPEGRWVKRGEVPWDALEELRDRPASIWINSDHTIQGHYDCMSAAEAATLDNSLLLVKKKDFTVQVATKTWGGKTKKTYRGTFEYKGTHHNFSLTDPIARSTFASKDPGDYPLNNVYLCISLTERYQEDGRCHKLVAAVFTNPAL